MARLSFDDGVVSALVLAYHADQSISVLYEEIVDAHGFDRLAAAAKKSGNYDMSGLKKLARQRRKARE